MFGHPLQVGTREELIEAARTSEEPAYYAVTRCADLPEHLIPIHRRGRNLRTPCEDCREICWYDSKNFIPFTTVLCLQCLAARAGIDITDAVTKAREHANRGTDR